MQEHKTILNAPWRDKEAENAETVPGKNDSPDFKEVVERGMQRRDLIKTLLSGAAAVAAGSQSAQAVASTGLTFKPIRLGKDQDYLDIPEGYEAGVLIKWGDPVVQNAPAFNPQVQNGASQSQQFGYNCDMITYHPLPDWRSNSSRRALMCVNHEYTDPQQMFPNWSPDRTTKDIVDAEIAAHGVSVIEIEEFYGTWQYNANSRFNRRITGETEMIMTGPAAGDMMLQTAADRSGTRVRGTLNNCAGGQTPWGTFLTAEENFNQYFANRAQMPAGVNRDNMARYGTPTAASARRWERFYDRFDQVKEPNEANRFGWVVEIDPYDPNSMPKKRTAMGRAKHENASSTIAKNGQVVVYSGDDERFDYAYKFVTAGVFNPDNRASNMDLLDNGTLYVARFNADGSGVWIPVVHGTGPLTIANGWRNQADVLIRCRQAADALGATRMDRPEDVEVNPVTGLLYIVCTNNTNRGLGSSPGTDAANPRANNRSGHIIEVREQGNDHAATTFQWGIFMLCGDPNDPVQGTYFAGAPREKVSPIGAPDNIAFDNQGNLWIGTDGMEAALGWQDAIYACVTEGPERGTLLPFMSVPLGAETCGPTFTPDNTTFFLAVQHPGEGGTFERPLSSWPTGSGLPRPAVVFVRKAWGRGVVGS
ncbi:MAG: PhoX family protein [Acidobacteriota bacterium]